MGIGPIWGITSLTFILSWGKADLSKGYRNPKKKLGVAVYIVILSNNYSKSF